MRIPLRAIRICLLVLVVPCAGLSEPGERHVPGSLPPFLNPAQTTPVSRTRLNLPLPVAFGVWSYQRGSITGQVVLPAGASVNNRIRITLSGGRIASQTAYTDNKGRFVFSNVSDGIYTLEILADPTLYEPVTQEVRLIYGAHPVLVISLNEKASASRAKTSIVSAAELDQKVPDAAMKEFEKGVQLSNQGKIEDAIERFKKALVIFPGYLMARNNLGAQYLKLGQWAEAAEQFETAIETNSKTFGPRLNLAIALIELRKYAEAIEDLTQAISIDSTSPAAYLYLGIASLGTDAIDEAERALTTSLSLGGAAHSLPHFYLALVHMKKGERDQAKRELKAYLEKAPKGDKAPRARQLLERLNQ